MAKQNRIFAPFTKHMKKDIIIPKVENVYVAALQEWNDDFMENTWYAYLVNDSADKLETVIVVSKAKGEINGEERQTGSLRHAFVEVLPDTAVKIEMIEESVLRLDNSFMVTFFKGNTLYDKNFVFRAGTINPNNAKTEVPVIFKDGILLK
ncbi:hypothetical protein SAMN05444144_11545 [Flavobacterium akiainvivens]|nr:hypothetical protein SAMN05444144_11545 [Flavobacterium akiainvivens]